MMFTELVLSNALSHDHISGSNSFNSIAEANIMG